MTSDNQIERVEVRYRPFVVKYHGTTDAHGSRISIRDLRHNKRKVIPYDSDHFGIGSVGEQATAYLRSIGISVDALALADVPINGTAVELLLSTDFATQLR